MSDTLAAGIVRSMPEGEYHSRPELSSTGARLLLDCPARFRWAQDNPEPFKKHFDVGSAVHAKVLGVGAGVVAIPESLLASNGAASTSAAKIFIAEAREAGLIPLKQAEIDEIDAISESVLAHPGAKSLLEQEGDSEASVFATDPDTGVRMRARFDFLPDFTVDDPVAVDLKTGLDASAEGFAKTAAQHRYDIQQEWYLLTYGLATGDFSLQMSFITVEKTPPYLVGVYRLGLDFQQMAHKQVLRALATFKACTENDLWPGYPLDVGPLQPPQWLYFQEGVLE